MDRPTPPGQTTGPAGGPTAAPEEVPPWPYIAAFTVLLLAGVAFGVMAREARRAQPDGPDLRVASWVAEHRDRWPGATRFFLAVTKVGDWPYSVLLSAGLTAAVGLLPRDHPLRLRVREAGFWLAVLASSWLLNRALKKVVGRDRPPEPGHLVGVDAESFSFPSGHAAFAGTYFALLAAVLLRHVEPGRHLPRAAIVLACLLAAWLVAASRVWLGVHYVSDVLGGLALGMGWIAAVWLVRSGWYRWSDRRSHRHEGPAAGGR
jgi:undecaprenyl-diphosphatase